MEHLDAGTSGEPSAAMVAAPSVARTDVRSLPRVANPHERKFRLASALLFILAAAAVAGAVVFLVNHDNKSNPVAAADASKWSDWHPTKSGNAALTQIADHISPYYLLNSSEPLDAITPISMSESNDAGVTTGSGLTVVVNPTTSAPSASNLELLTGKTVAYNICGLGPSDCQLSGTATTARMLLLRREALELALYTFKYVPSTQNVIAVLPPGHTVTSTGAGGSAVTVSVLFVRSELASLLKRPLDKLLSSSPLALSELSLWSQTGEAELVDTLTTQALFSSQVESQQEGGSLLVLSPLAQ